MALEDTFPVDSTVVTEDSCAWMSVTLAQKSLKGLALILIVAAVPTT